jgi:hypothetical protein
MDPYLAQDLGHFVGAYLAALAASFIDPLVLPASAATAWAGARLKHGAMLAAAAGALARGLEELCRREPPNAAALLGTATAAAGIAAAVRALRRRLPAA